MNQACNRAGKILYGNPVGILLMLSILQSSKDGGQEMILG